MTRPDDPAYPDPEEGGKAGMTIREYLACHIMSGLASDKTTREYFIQWGTGDSKKPILPPADVAVAWADALIAALNTKEPPKCG